MKNAFILLSFFVIMSCHNENSVVVENTTVEPDGALLYKERCISCHGADGKLGFAGAKDLTLSKKTHQEIITQVTNGKGAMTPFKNILAPEEIDAVSSYAVSLQKK